MVNNEALKIHLSTTHRRAQQVVCHFAERKLGSRRRFGRARQHLLKLWALKQVTAQVFGVVGELQQVQVMLEVVGDQHARLEHPAHFGQHLFGGSA